MRASAGDPAARVVRLVPPATAPVAAPDAWTVLQTARAAAGASVAARLAGVGLNHLLVGCSHVAGLPISRDVARRRASPPPRATASRSTSWPAPAAGHPCRGSASRPTTSRTGTGRRPVVAVLDTGCGEHPWFEHGVVRDVVREVNGQVVHAGETDPDTDPELTGDIVGPMDGALDTHAGHGTFIAGLVRQICPQADIWAIRVMCSDGVVEEGDLIRALAVLNGLVDDARRGRPAGAGRHRVPVARATTTS